MKLRLLSLSLIIFSLFIFSFIISLPCFSQQDNSSQKLTAESNKDFEAQFISGLHLNGDPFNTFGAEARLNYYISDGLLLGIGAMYSYDVEQNFYTPNASLTAKFSMNKISPYARVAAGPNFSSFGGSSAGLYFSVGAGVEYKINEKTGINFELGTKNFSYHKKEMESTRVKFGSGLREGDETHIIYYSYFSPSLGINYKF